MFTSYKNRPPLIWPIDGEKICTKKKLLDANDVFERSQRVWVFNAACRDEHVLFDASKNNVYIKNT